MTEYPIRQVAITSGDDADSRISGAANENPMTDASKTRSGEAGGVFGAAVGAVMEWQNSSRDVTQWTRRLSLLRLPGRRIARSGLVVSATMTDTHTSTPSQSGAALRDITAQ